MRKNRKRKAFLHSAMRSNSFSRKGEKSAGGLVLSVVFMLVFVIGGWFLYSKLYSLWIEQCEITDLTKQVSITTGENIKADTILEVFNIRKGGNLAKIDFKEKHKEAIEKIPNMKTLTILRHLPDRVEIHVEEREPMARIGVKAKVKEKEKEIEKIITSGRVVDEDGIVFLRQHGTSDLPIILESGEKPSIRAGQKLTGRVMAALQLLAVCRDDFPDLKVKKADTNHSDYIILTICDNSQPQVKFPQVKISWKDMDSPTAETADALKKQLSMFQSALQVGGSEVKVWTVTSPNRVTGDTKEPIL